MVILKRVQSLHDSIGAVYLQPRPLHFIPSATLPIGLVGLLLVDRKAM